MHLAAKTLLYVENRDLSQTRNWRISVARPSLFAKTGPSAALHMPNGCAASSRDPQACEFHNRALDRGLDRPRSYILLARLPCCPVRALLVQVHAVLHELNANAGSYELHAVNLAKALMDYWSKQAQKKNQERKVIKNHLGRYPFHTSEWRDCRHHRSEVIPRLLRGMDDFTSVAIRRLGLRLLRTYKC